MRTGLGGLLLALAAVPACSGGPDAEGVMLASSTRGDPARGEAAIRRLGCGACHVIPGVAGARGMVGPPLTDLARRSYLAGRVANAADNLVAWIRRPDSVEPGTVMPALGVSDRDARDIAAYLYLETSTGGLGPPRLLPGSFLRPD